MPSNLKVKIQLETYLYLLRILSSMDENEGAFVQEIISITRTYLKIFIYSISLYCHYLADQSLDTIDLDSNR